ncbi:hypothetical protein [Rhizobium fabae]|uniref:Uncharacterized protein n=1 Tax=Rhizobium fabae TaxID=573179 RepID=A0A7W6B2W6_9HYPH|nr:hypothetical protein [Rhizobium fabae]MBB3914590.1 hypothetical protein [Rhizobium fabae]RUM14500.1 hypothetical protein EFB14_07145 [Rhizobium fabae]
MGEHQNEWTRVEAEKGISQVLDAAKELGVQRVSDGDGTFEVRFVSSRRKIRAQDYLARGGPIDE